MSGHSKWAKIKRQKGANDTKRGNLFTKLAKNITLAAKEGGTDPDMNFTLRLAVDKAKTANMPSDNIQRAIDRANGKGDQDVIVRVSYEALGPSGVSVIIDSQTDNTNRTVAEIRNLVESNGGKFASTGSVSWKFQEKGMITIKYAKKQKSEKFGKGDITIKVDPEETMMEILEVPGVEDIEQNEVEQEDVLEIYTGKDVFNSVLKSIEEMGYEVLSADLIKTATENISLNPDEIEKVSSFVEKIEEHDDVDAVWVDL